MEELSKYWVNEVTRSPRLLRGIPPVGSRPFLVAGLVAVWLGLYCPIPSDLQIEDFGNGNSDGMDAGTCSWSDALSYTHAETLDKVGVTFLTNSLVIEFPEVIVQNHLAQMSNLPSYLDNSN